MIKFLTKTREWYPLGGGQWQGKVYYQNDANGQPKTAVRWTNKNGKIEIATTGHGGIDTDTAKAYADALLIAIAEAQDATEWGPGGDAPETYGGE